MTEKTVEEYARNRGLTHPIDISISLGIDCIRITSKVLKTARNLREAKKLSLKSNK